MFHGESLDPEKLEKLQEALSLLNGFLSGHKWAAGDVITVADHSLAASVSSFTATGVVDLSKHSNVEAWLARCEAEMPGYAEVNTVGANEFGELYKAKLV